MDSTRDAVEGGQTGYIRLVRTGDTSQELTVTYSIDTQASQATPGVDFSYLSGTSAADPVSGSITLGVGASQADISVAALTDAAVEGNETLRIVLTSSSAATYQLGSPSSATIMVVDAPVTRAKVSIGQRANEVQTLILPEASGGTWTLSLGTSSTSALVPTASALEVQTALEALAPVGTGNVTVTGDGQQDSPFTITFRGARATTDLPQITVDISQLTGIAQPTATVDVEVEGVDGTNEAYEVLVRSSATGTDLASGGGQLRFYWGPLTAGVAPFNDPQRQSPAVAWNASTSDLASALEQIPSIANAGGTVSVEQVAVSSWSRRLRVEFTGDLGSQDLSELVAQNDLAGTGVYDTNGEPAVVETNKLTDGALGTTNEIQLVALAHAQGGTFQLAYRNHSTQAIARAATAAVVEQQLAALTGIGADNVSVTGPAGGPWHVAFHGRLAGRNLESLSVDGAGLTGGQAYVATVTDGGTILDATHDAHEGSETGWFRIYRTGATTDSLIVYFAVQTEGTTASANDYDPLPQYALIASGSSYADILVRPIDDSEVEGDETLRLALVSQPDYLAGIQDYEVGDPSAATLMIADNDFVGPLLPVSIVAVQDAAEGGLPGYFHIARPAASNEAVTVNYVVDTSSTADAQDYQPLSGSVIIPGGEVGADIVVTAIDDALVEGDEVLRITLTSVITASREYTGTATAEIHILDNDTTSTSPKVWIADRTRAYEGGVNGWFRRARTNENLAQPLTVHFVIEPLYSTAQNGVDFEFLPGTSADDSEGDVTFPAGASTVLIPVNPIDDTVVAPVVKKVRITLIAGGPDSYALKIPNTESVRIIDNDLPDKGPYVDWLRLVDDPNHDLVTADPRVNGIVLGNFHGGSARIEFDKNRDFQPDGSVMVQVSASVFTYDPRVLDATFAAVLGAKVLNYRAVNVAADGTVLETGKWKSLAFRLEADPNVGPVRLDGVQLLRDTGPNATDRITINPTLIGKVLGDLENHTARVEFEHDGDDTPEGSRTVSAQSRSFQYDPVETDPTLEGYSGSWDLRYRLVTTDRITNEVTVGTWTTFSMTLEPAPLSSYLVTGLAMSQDNEGEFATGLPVLSGDVWQGQGSGTGSGSGGSSGGSSSGGDCSATGNGSGTGSGGDGGGNYDPNAFLPSGMGSGSDSSSGGGSGGYLSDPAGNADPGSYGPPSSAGGGYTNGQNSSGSGGTCTFSLIVPIEFDYDGDGKVDGKTTTAADGGFRYWSSGLSYGTHTIRARALQWDVNYGTYLRGPWSTFTFTWEPEQGPALASLALADDTGTSATDGVTSDALLHGKLAVAVNFAAEFRIEYDQDGDGVVDGSTWNDAQGEFEFRPLGLAAGNVSVQARSVQWDPVAGGGVPGDWFSVSFNFQPVQAPQLQTFTLLADTGTSSTDGVTSISTLVGQVSTAADLAGMEVVFDHNGDGLPDGSVEPQADGQFLYEPENLGEGAHTVRARTRVWDGNTQQYVCSPWSQLTFTLEPIPNAAIEVGSLQLKHDTGASSTDHLTWDATLTGNLGNDGAVAYQTVEFDRDADGVADASVIADANGDFTYLPPGLSLGTHTIAARGVEWDYRNQQQLYGPWTTLTFTLEAETNAVPVVQTVGLLSDSGSSATDGATANPTLVGQLADDRQVAGMTVEVDWNGDGNVDQVTTADDQGRFRIEPTGLAFGSISVKVRGVEWDEQQGAYARGAWSTLNFTYEDQPNAPARLNSLELVAPASYASDATTSLTGRITNEGALDQVAVEFDYDGDGTVDQTVLTDRDGVFSVQPNSLPTGTTTVHVRTRETDQAEHQTLYSSWSAITVNNTPSASEPLQVSQLSLVQDDGSSSTDKITSNSQLQGQLNHRGRGEFVVVQFDHNGDGRPDGQITVDSDLQFTYAPQGLPSGDITIRARTKDYDQNATAVYSGWYTFQFRLEVSANAQPNITQIGLAADTGSATHDFSTSNGTLTGTVAGITSANYTWLEYDVNGDETADGTAYVSNGSFSFAPYNLHQGLNTVRLRTATYASGGATVHSSWVPLSFVLSSDPDGTAAQALVPVAGALNQAARASDGLGPGGSAPTAMDTANSQYDTDVGAATATRNQSVQTAQNAHTAAVAAADAAYLSAVQTAQAAFVTNMASFTGDPTHYTIEPLTWPAAPAANGVQIPADGDQPQPPSGLPTYEGPAYDWDADPLYQTAKATLEATYQIATASADQALSDAKQAAQTTYTTAVAAANNQYSTDAQAAQQAYWTAMQAPNASGIDINLQQQNYATALQAAWDAYEATWEANWNTLDGAGDAAYATLTAATNAIWTNYSSHTQTAWNSAYAVLSNPNATQSQRQAAYLTYGQTCYSERKTADQDVADARRQYDLDMAGAWKQYRLDMSVADLAHDQAVSAAQEALDTQFNSYASGGRSQYVVATHTLQQTLLDAERQRSKAIADAEKIRADAEADAIRTHDLDVATATVTRWQVEVAARQTQLATWNTVVGTPWTAYQLALVNSEATYTTQRSAAYMTQTTATADATRTESQATATAAKARSYAQADAAWLHGKERLDAKVTYWDAKVLNVQIELQDNALQRQQLRDDLAQVDKDYNDTYADVYYTWSDQTSLAYYNHDTTLINARQWIVNPTYGYGYESTDSNDWINAGADLNIALLNVNHDYQIALIDASQTRGDDARTASKQFSDDAQSSNGTQNSTTGDALAVYHKALADADKKYAVQVVKDDGTQQTAWAAIDVAFVSVTALADKQFADAEAQLTQTRDVADAGSQRSYQVAEATQHLAAMTAWNTTENSRWSQYHLDLATVELAWATATGNADVTQVTATAAADYTQATTVATADQTLANAQSLASQAQVVAMVAATNTYADNVGAAKLNYASCIRPGMPCARRSPMTPMTGPCSTPTKRTAIRPARRVPAPC
ncbi:MAG: hypothetical protein NTY19_24210 [Planctomycetota bacterium]|nr:hypothetical protein [Planctomycetota bacterium]